MNNVIEVARFKLDARFTENYNRRELFDLCEYNSLLWEYSRPYAEEELPFIVKLSYLSDSDSSKRRFITLGMVCQPIEVLASHYPAQLADVRFSCSGEERDTGDVVWHRTEIQPVADKPKWHVRRTYTGMDTGLLTISLEEMVERSQPVRAWETNFGASAYKPLLRLGSINHGEKWRPNIYVSEENALLSDAYYFKKYAENPSFGAQVKIIKGFS